MSLDVRVYLYISPVKDVITRTYTYKLYSHILLFMGRSHVHFGQLGYSVFITNVHTRGGIGLGSKRMDRIEGT